MSRQRSTTGLTLLASLFLLSPGTGLAAGQAGGPGIAGPWHGAIVVASVTLTIRVVFTESDGALGATIDIPQQGAAGIALRAVTVDGPKVRFELPAGQTVAVFDGTREGDRIAGPFTQGPAAGTFHLERGEAPPPGPKPDLPYRAEDVTFANGAVTLAATLTIPPGDGPFPAVVMLTGSGPQNRDEELFGFKVFGVIADHLTRQGIAVLRYDDRGVGGSSGGNSDPTTDDLAGDALAGLSLVAARPEIDRARVGLFGHSEGAVVAAIAAARSTDVAFIVMMAGTATPGEEVLRRQAADLAHASGATDTQVARILESHRAMLDAVRGGAGAAEIERATRALAAAQIDALPEAQRSRIPDRDAYIDTLMPQQMAGLQSRWMRYFIDFDPATALAKVRCPVLALFGGKDMQVPEDVNRSPLEKALAAGGNTKVTVKTYADANHLFITAVTGSPAEYATLEKTFVPGFLDDATAWIKAVNEVRALGVGLKLEPNADSPEPVHERG